MALPRTEPLRIEPLRRRRAAFWFAFLVLAVAWHAVMLTVPWDRLIPAVPLPRAPVEVRAIDAEQLEAMRRQWRKLKDEKPLVLGKDDAPEKDTTPAPDNARYSSDRNRVVEREQRAARRDVLPREGGGGTKTKEAAPQQQPDAKSATGKKPTTLSSLGVPLPQPGAAKSTAAGAGAAMIPGADQELLDESLPEGAENILNTQRSKYYSFYSRIYEAIAPIWQSRIREVSAAQESLPPGDYVTYATALLDSDGRLIEIRIEKSSGVRAFDEAASYAWRKIGRFPNPPRDLIGRDGVTEVAFSFTVRFSKEFRFSYPRPRRLTQ